MSLGISVEARETAANQFGLLYESARLGRSYEEYVENATFEDAAIIRKTIDLEPYSESTYDQFRETIQTE